MDKSGLPFGTQLPSNGPPKSQFYERKQGSFENNSVEKESNDFEDQEYNVVDNIVIPELKIKNYQELHIHKEINADSKEQDSVNTLNVVDSYSVSEVAKGDRPASYSKNHKNNTNPENHINNFQQIRSKFENKTKQNSSILAEKRSINYTKSEEKIKEALKLSRENLNAVKELKKDVAYSRLPIMYQDDVEALLSRKPNSVRNFVNSLNKQLNNFSNKNNDYKFKFGNYETKYPILNQNNYYKGGHANKEGLDGKIDLKLEELNLKLENLGREGLFGQFDEFRDFVNFEKYISNKNKLRENDKLNLAKSMEGHKQEDRDNMLTFRSNSFGNLTMSTQVSDFEKNEDPYTNSRDDFCLNKFNRSLYSGNCFSENDFNYGNEFGDHFNNYKNDSFKHDKISSRSNLTRIHTDDSTKSGREMAKKEAFYGNAGNYYQQNGSDYANEKEYSQPENKLSFVDILFSKRFLQSFNTLPEGVNLVIDTPKSESMSRRRNHLKGHNHHKNDAEIFINSVNVIKSGWVWVQSSKTKNWVPKFMVLFYDKERSPKNQYTQLIPNYPKVTSKIQSINYNNYYITNHRNCQSREHQQNGTSEQPKDYNRYFQGETNKSNDGFWGIYQVYTQLNPNLNPMNVTNKVFNSPSSFNSGINPNCGTEERLIKDNSVIYLCILNYEPTDYFESITNRNYLQLYKVDTSIAPYLRSFNSCWLSKFLSQKIKTNLELIIISLEDNYECCFVPLCAAKLDPKVRFSYEMQLAYNSKVNQEYDQWIFKLWEYSLRSMDYNSSISTTCADLVNHLNNINQMTQSVADVPEEEPVLENEGLFSKCYRYICSLFNGSTGDSGANSTNKATDKSKLRARIIESIHNNNGTNNQHLMEADNPSNRVTDQDQVGYENQPSPQNFINWIDKYGFDDLSIKMNMYTLINRV